MTKDILLKDLKLSLIAEEAKEAKFHLSYFADYLEDSFKKERYRENYSKISHLLFLDIFPFIKSINMQNEPTQEDDLPIPCINENIEERLLELDTEWIKEMNRGNPRLIKTFLSVYKKSMLKVLASYLSVIATKVLAIFFFGYAIKNLDDFLVTPQEIDKEKFLEAIYYFTFSLFASNVLNTYYWNIILALSQRIKLTLIGLVYKKLHSVSFNNLRRENLSQVINLLSNDINSMESTLLGVLPYYASPFIGGIFVFYTWQFFGWFTLIGFIALYLFQKCGNLLTKNNEFLRIERNNATNKRAKVFNDIIKSIKTYKCYGWQESLVNIVGNSRSIEQTKFLNLNYKDILARSVLEPCVYWSCFIVFVLYDTFDSDSLTSQKVFTYLLVMNFVRLWCFIYYNLGSKFINNLGGLQTKLKNILLMKDIISIEETKFKSVPSYHKSHRNSSGGLDMRMMNSSYFKKRTHASPIFLRKFTAYWHENSQLPCLENITLAMRPSEVVAVIGKIGSGKTSLLLSLINEVPVIQGEMFCEGTTALVQNDPHIFPGTVRQNILLGLEYEEELYQHIQELCDMEFEFNRFPENDQTIIGEKGYHLTKAQKTKISLARALYSRSDIFLFDDPWSAFDIYNGVRMFKSILHSDLLIGKITIFSTKSEVFIKEADNVIVLENGKLVAKGSYGILKSQGIELANYLQQQPEPEVQLLNEIPRVLKIRSRLTLYENEDLHESEESDINNVDEIANETKVTYQTYKKYLSFAKEWKIIGIILLYFLNSLFLITFFVILTLWLNEETYKETSSNGANKQTEASHIRAADHRAEYTGGLMLGTLFLFIHVITKYIKMRYLNKFILETNSEIYKHVASRLFNASITIFDSTFQNKVMNSMHIDMATLDKHIWVCAHDILEGVTTIVIIFIVLCYISLDLVIVAIFFAIAFLMMSKYFAKPMIVAKKIEGSLRIPNTDHLASVISGLMIIRVLRRGGYFIQEYAGILYSQFRVGLFLQQIKALLSLSADLVFFIVIICTIYVLIYSKENSDAVLLGLTIISILVIMTNSSLFMRQAFKLEAYLQNFENLFAFTELKQEPPSKIEEKDNSIQVNDPKWPSKGHLQFKNVSLSYLESSRYALRNISFKAEPKKIYSFVGRASSGKSSIINALLNLIKSDLNSQVLIDHIDNKTIGTHLLRSKIAYIPRETAIFEESIRKNLDPQNDLKDYEIWDALQLSGLKNTVESLKDGIWTIIHKDTRLLNSEQKHLLMLTRALLKKNAKILIMEDSHPDISDETEEYIHNVATDLFKQSTILKISRKLTQVSKSTKVISLENNRIVEDNHPYLLLVLDEKDEEITHTIGLFARLALGLGEAKSKEIFDKCKEECKRFNFSKSRGDTLTDVFS